MKTFVQIHRGMYRNHSVSGLFEVKVPLKVGTKGNYITVKLAEQRPPYVVIEPRIRVENSADYFYCTSAGKIIDDTSVQFEQLDFEEQLRALETDDDIKERMRNGFKMFDDLVVAVAEGLITGLIVSGPPGVGKSYGAIQTLEQINIPRVLAGLEPNYVVITGAVSHIGLYQILYNNSKEGQVTIFDDCDCIWSDEPSLNSAKTVLDTGGRRHLSWNTETSILERAGVPDAFDFKGSVIFLTNINFEHVRAGKMRDHMQAILSRCHYLDLEISNQRDQLLRVRQVVEDGMLKAYNFRNGEEQMILSYIDDNADHLREISLRMVKKMADLVQVKPDDCFKFIEATCLHRPAKFKRLLEARTAVIKPVIEAPPSAHASTPEPAEEPTDTDSGLMTAARGPGDLEESTPPPTADITKSELPEKVKEMGSKRLAQWIRNNGGKDKYNV